LARALKLGPGFQLGNTVRAITLNLGLCPNWHHSPKGKLPHASRRSPTVVGPTVDPSTFDSEQFAA
jgi:hypothetical protein